MTIIHIIFTLNIGGAETMLVDIVNEQCKECDVTLIVIDDSYNTELLEAISAKVKIVLLKRRPSSRTIIPFVRLNWLLMRANADVIHIHNWQTPRILLPCFKPFFTVHGLGRPTTYYHRLKGLIAISEAVKSDVEKNGNYPVIMIPNGIVVEKIQKKERLNGNRLFKIVQVGRLEIELKGQDILIEAIAKLRCEGVNNIVVDIIGEGGSKDFLKSLIEKLDLTERVHLLGAMERTQLYHSLCQYDLLCQPSRKEGFGLTVVEAMAAKLPVLVSNSGGPFEIIKAGQLGYYFINDNADSCAEEIKKIINNYGNEQMSFFVESAYEKVVQEYSIKGIVHKYSNFYKGN